MTKQTEKLSGAQQMLVNTQDNVPRCFKAEAKLMEAFGEYCYSYSSHLSDNPDLEECAELAVDTARANVINFHGIFVELMRLQVPIYTKEEFDKHTEVLVGQTPLFLMHRSEFVMQTAEHEAPSEKKFRDVVRTMPLFASCRLDQPILLDSLFELGDMLFLVEGESFRFKTPEVYIEEVARHEADKD